MILVIRCQTLLKTYGKYEVVAYMYFTVTIITIFFINVYTILFLFNNVIYVFLLYDYIFSLYVYVWLPWLRFVRAFSSVVRQMPG
jgi:hypothetical protein